MNFHDDKWIMNKLEYHWKEALKRLPPDRIVGLFLQGSQNYGVDYEGSDVDTKLVIVPTFEDIVFMKKPISTTIVLENNEHIDIKDIRLMLGEFRKQNLNFLEILFTKYKIVNPMYEEYWDKLVSSNEKIARYNPVVGVQSMAGIARTKYLNLKTVRPSSEEVIAKFGYSPKELHHLMRINEYLVRYINNEPYKDCMASLQSNLLVKVKQGFFTLPQAEAVADQTMEAIDTTVKAYLAYTHTIDKEVESLLNEVQLEIMRKAMVRQILYEANLFNHG